MIVFFRQLIRPHYETLNVVKIDAAKLLANFRYLSNLQPRAAMFPVLKSNAYGHGLKEVCLILNKVNPALVAIDSFPEAQIAYRYFKGKILILGEMSQRAYSYCQLNRTEFVVYNEETLKYLSRYGKRARLHLFVNSGMNREGIKDLPAFILKNIAYLNKVEIVGLCSHLASADQETRLNQAQLDNFRFALKNLKAAGFNPHWVHLGNSAAIFTINDDLLTAYRPGLAFYGYSPFSIEEKREVALEAALEVFSQIISLQELKSAESVSYNETYLASQETKIGVIPFGYFEGLDRRLSNRAELLVQSKNDYFWAKIAGRVCMNLTCLDLGQHRSEIGDLVKIVSAKREDRNSLTSLAGLANTIPYEFLVKLQANIHREIINN